MKKTLALISLMVIGSTMVFGQIKVGANNNIGIGSITGDPLSKVSVGDAGAATAYFNINSPLTVDYSKGLYVYQNQTPAHRYSIYGNTLSVGGYAFGIFGSSYNSTVGSSGRSYGVYGQAGNASGGYNYGVYGYLLGSNNGAGVFGTTSGDVGVDGKYAGYFYGNVKITGNGYVNGSVLITSDITAKKEIAGLSSGNMSKISQLNGIKYKLKTPAEMNLSKANAQSDTINISANLSEEDLKVYNKQRIGLSAQEVQKIYPELVETDNSGMLAVDYIGLIPVLIEALKEQQAEIEQLKAEIKQLTK